LQAGSSRLVQPQAEAQITKAMSDINILDEDESTDTNSSGPPPSRPDNPELIQAKQALHSKLQAAYNQHMSTHASECNSLHTLQQDLLKGEPAILDEMGRLGAVRDVCAGVRDKYAESVEKARRNVDDLNARADPGVDEIVSSTTVVYNQ